MARNVDYIIDATKNSKIAVRRLHRAVTGKVWPVAPVFAFRILVVLAVVLRHKTVAVAINGLEHSRPGISDTDIPGFT